MKCPRCGLINDDDARNCDCGYNFNTQAVDRGFVRRVRRFRTWKRWHWLLGIGLYVIVLVAGNLAWSHNGTWVWVVPGILPIAWALSWTNVRS